MKSSLISASLLILLLLALLLLAQKGLCAKFSRHAFPSNFVFGAGTSAFQYEGAAAEDGRTPSILDIATQAGWGPGKSNGRVAADGYHKYKEDAQLMSDTGLEAYRFSISWSRLIPYGRGTINLKAVEYYNNVIDELTKRGLHIYAHNPTNIHTLQKDLERLLHIWSIDIIFAQLITYIIFQRTLKGL